MNDESSGSSSEESSSGSSSGSSSLVSTFALSDVDGCVDDVDVVL